MRERYGVLFLVSGPSGSGKTTLCRRLADEGEAHYSVSCTTRLPRPGELDGIDYHFMPKERFVHQINEGGFLEFAEVHGNHYGTLKSEVVALLEKGLDVVMDLDVQGARSVRSCEDPMIQHSLVDLFVSPPSQEELRSRLMGRGTDSQEVIELRMKNALEEMKFWPEYTYRIVSEGRDTDYLKFKSLLISQRLKASLLK